MKYKFLFFLTSFVLPHFIVAQDASALAKKVQAKLAAVNDYQATGILKLDISFMNIPPSEVTIYYKKPDKFRIWKKDGITVTPKGGASFNLNALIAGKDYTVVYAGKGQIHGTLITIIKILPLEELSDVVLSTLYVNEKDLLIYKATTTTKSNGTYEMEMAYGKFAEWALPDKVTFFFDTKDYKLPKGLAFDYDPGNKPAVDNKAPKSSKGKVEISYSSYLINQGVSETLFK